MSKQLIWTLVVLLFLTGCNFPGLAPAVSPDPAVGAEPQTAAPTPIPSPFETLPPSPEPEPTVPDPICVAPGEAGELAAPVFGDYPGAIKSYLNRGAAPEALQTALEEAGVANVPLAVAAEDLTGDGVREVVVSIFNPESTLILPAGTAMIYVCEAGQYRLAYSEESVELFGAPHIWYVQDLDAEGAAEVVLSRATCGAHTCFEDLSVFSWEGAAFIDRLEGETLDLGYPDIRVEDPDGDGIFALDVVSGGIASVGAGPQREVTRRWSLDAPGGSWVPGPDSYGPSNFRVHILHDAEAAMRAGDLAGSLALYERVVTDPALDEWQDPEAERANLAAYARFKQVVVYTLEGQADFAAIALGELRAAFGEGTPQRPYVELAEAFWAGWEAGGAVEGCAAAEAFAGAHAEAVLAPLGPLFFGYANPEITAEDVCP